jgi:O-antigen/teichoic acid export membrane protein
MNLLVPSRAQRLFAGWSANFFQMALAIIQQVALVPIFLHFWSSDVLAAWLAIYAAGNLVLVVDMGLQFRAINRFLAFKSTINCDGRTGRFYNGMRRSYFIIVAFTAVVLLAGTQFISPSAVLGFQAIPNFDIAFLVMTGGMLFMVPAGLVSGLYRARGLYGRVVWLQNLGMLIAQLGQLIAIIATGNLLGVTIAYAVTQVLTAVYLIAIDAPRLFPFLRRLSAKHSWRWTVGQFRRGIPFAIAGATELALLNLPVLLVSALVSDRVAVAQWGLTRVIAGLIRGLCVQATLPLAAELGHDHAVGQCDQLRHLYAQGSLFVALLASGVVSGLLPFWSDFFALWTHDSVPYDAALTLTLLIGTGVMAPSILALSFASYSNRGNLLIRTKGLQLLLFLALSLALIPTMGPLGAAIAIVASDLLIQYAVLTLIIMRQTLQHPFQHVAFLTIVAAIVTLSGWLLGAAIRSFVPGTGFGPFFVECSLWLAAVAVFVSPLTSKRLRHRLIAAIPC